MLTGPVVITPLYDILTPNNVQVKYQLIKGLRLLEISIKNQLIKGLRLLEISIKNIRAHTIYLSGKTSPVINENGFYQYNYQQNGNYNRSIEVNV